MDEGVGVGIVRVPSPDLEICGAAAGDIQVLRHRLVDRADPESRRAERVAQLLREQPRTLRRTPGERPPRAPRSRGTPSPPRSCRRRSPAARLRGGACRRVPEQPGWNQAVGRDREPSERAPDDAGHVDGAGEAAAELDVPERPAIAVEGDEVRREPGALPVPGREPGVLTKRFRVGREQVRGDEKAGPRETRRASLRAERRSGRRFPRSSDSPRASSAGFARAPAAGRARRRRRGRDRFRRHSPASSCPGLPVPSGTIARRGSEMRAGKKETGLSRSIVELGRRDDVESLEPGRHPVQERRAPRIGASSQRLVALPVQQKPLEGVPHVPRASAAVRRETGLPGRRRNR